MEDLGCERNISPNGRHPGLFLLDEGFTPPGAGCPRTSSAPLGPNRNLGCPLLFFLNRRGAGMERQMTQTARDIFVVGLRNAHAMEVQARELMELAIRKA
jgi:hypothetical protein